MGIWFDLYRKTELADNEIEYMRDRLVSQGVESVKMNPKALNLD